MQGPSVFAMRLRLQSMLHLWPAFGLSGLLLPISSLLVCQEHGHPVFGWAALGVRYAGGFSVYDRLVP